MKNKNLLHEICDDMEKQLEMAKRLIPEDRLMNPGEAQHLDSMLHSAKSLETIIAMVEHGKEGKQEDESGNYARYRADGNANGNGGMYGDGGNYGAMDRDSRGRFREGGGESYGYYPMMAGQYYRENGAHPLRDALKNTMKMARSEEERRVLEKAMQQLESM